MPINPLIALQGRVPDIGGDISRILGNVQSMQQIKRAPQEQQLLEDKLSLIAQQKESGALDLAAKKELGPAASMSAKDNARLASISAFAKEISPLLASGDNEGAIVLAKSRMSQLQKAGLDQDETAPLLRALESDPAKAKTMIDQTLKLAGITDNLKLRAQETRASELELKKQKFEASKTKLSAGMQKILDTAQTDSIDSGKKSNEFNLLADDLLRRQSIEKDVGGGSGSTFSEMLKSFTGSQEAVTDLRRRFNAVRLSQALKNLPPGPATDKDVNEAFKGVPKENANAETMISFLRGMSKLEQLNEKFQTFKSDLIGQQGNTKGLLPKWKEEIKDFNFEETAPLVIPIKDMSTSDLKTRLSPETRKRLGM